MSQTETKLVYHIYVIGKNETRLSPYGTMPRDLEAFNCEGDQLQLIKRTSLVEKFRSYKDNRTQKFTLVHKKASKEIEVRTCKISITQRAGKCVRGWLGGLILMKKGNYKLSKEECKEAYKDGYRTSGSESLNQEVPTSNKTVIQQTQTPISQSTCQDSTE